MESIGGTGRSSGRTFSILQFRTRELAVLGPSPVRDLLSYSEGGRESQEPGRKDGKKKKKNGRGREGEQKLVGRISPVIVMLSKHRRLVVVGCWLLVGWQAQIRRSPSSDTVRLFENFTV